MYTELSYPDGNAISLYKNISISVRDSFKIHVEVSFGKFKT